jgi:hypothetical protein
MLKNSLYGLVVVVVLLNVSCCNAINIPGLRFPLHASCKLTWSWDKTDCLTIHDAILKQIDSWKTDDNCPNGAGEKCLYTLKSQTLTEIKATHTTPKKGYIDDLTFSFVAGTGICNINVSHNCLQSSMSDTLRIDLSCSRPIQPVKFGMPFWTIPLTIATCTIW